MYLIKDNEEVMIIPKGYDINKTLPVGNWIVSLTQEGFKLNKSDSYVSPSKIYGDIGSLKDRILKSYNKGTGNMGVLLRGLKGTGKTTLAKELCIASNLPVLLVNEAFPPTEFGQLISCIKAECIVLFEEFDKTHQYDHNLEKNPQEGLLTVLDGAITGKKLFLFTANDGRLHDALLNRPGRIKYNLKFEGLSDEVVSELISDDLEDPKKEKEVRYVLGILNKVTMDIVGNLISEVNTFPELSVVELANTLNISPEGSTFIVTWSEGGSSSLSSKSTERSAVCEDNPLAMDYIHLSPRDEAPSISMWMADCTIRQLAKGVLEIDSGKCVYLFTPKETPEFIFKDMPKDFKSPEKS